MAVFQSLGELAGAVTGDRHAAVLDVADPGIPLVDYDGGTSAASIASIWRRQPAVRKVVSFIAANIASIPLHVYERRSDTDRPRVTDGALAALVARPSHAVGQTPRRFWERLLIDGLLYDRWAAMIVDGEDGPQLVRIPPRKFRLRTDGLDLVTAVRVTRGDGTTRDLDPADFLLDVGYAQSSGRGTSPILTLTALLEEAAEAVEYRRTVMRRAARHTGWVGRDTPWPSRTARANFLESLRALERDGERAGGTALLDDGMEWHDRSYKPTDIDDLEARQLTDVEVCTAYHIAPELLGIRQGTYSNMESMRESLYRDYLGPYIAVWEQALSPLADRYSDGRRLYIEANLDAKLRGSFEEQARNLQTATGAPWLTRNEARAKANLPAIDGGDDLVTPLNVLVGGQTSPTDSGVQNQAAAPSPAVKAGGREVKARGMEGEWPDRAAAVLTRHFARQRRAVLSALGAKAADWWDTDRWNRELAEDLDALAAEIVAEVGPDTCQRLGFDPDGVWSTPRTRAYLAAVTRARAQWVNDATRAQIEQALAADTDPATVFDRAEAQRTGAGGHAFAAAMVAWAVLEAGRQAAPGQGTKTWVAGPNPRPSHAALDGETVPQGETFSNGLTWPGDPSLGADECAGCNCSVNLTI
ncbi:hypothetical protein CWT12_12290 [Actinomyces sp. 432]|uniref:phage portal protein n=1 Tax=Actinomyces sp. 432 TaxID=2057798 RepID=UPI001374641A|nr:phage portal protein [Actinomyces sp. 432]QHO91931.1 hypothetical protein CWT12_12290 [Actinomyces sp. 432]